MTCVVEWFGGPYDGQQIAVDAPWVRVVEMKPTTVAGGGLVVLVEWDVPVCGWRLDWTNRRLA
jgi:hypothetical protein